MKLYNFSILKYRFVYIYLSALLIFCFSPVFLTHPSAATTSTTVTTFDSDFPLYPVIKPNVNFWIDVFTKYSKSQGIIHDSRNLSIIYEVIKLDDSNTLRAHRKNRNKKKAIIKKYKSILLQLSKGKASLSDSEVKKVLAHFKTNAKPKDFKNAAYNIRCQTGIKQQFKKGLQRSGAVIDEFKRIFLSHGLPVDLIFLPCVESSYNFKAYSKFGAAGIWQFTRSTGKQYMKIGYTVDERRDPYISTDAAARLLKKNFAALKKWPLAITAYNHGLAGMQRAKKSKGSYQKIVKNYHSRSFKFASRNFYSEFLAARIVAKNPEKYFDNIKYDKPLSYKTIKTTGFLSVKQLAQILNCEIKDIKALNPALRKPVFNGQKYIPKGFKLRLTKNMLVKNFKKKLKALYKQKQKPSRFHRVQKGDTAGSIARIHSVKLNDLILANSLNRKATIYIGQNLRIPVEPSLKPSLKVTKDLLAVQSLPEKITILESKTNVTPKNRVISKKTPEKNIKIKLEQKPKKAFNSTESVAPVAQVEKREESLAKPIKDKISINPNIVTANIKILKTYFKNKNLIGVTKVETEETLGHYADWLQIPTKKIRRLNKFPYGQHITVDQKIKIPLKNKTVQEFEELRYEFHKEMEEDFFESFDIESIDTYEVKAGDNIWNLCLNKLEIPFWLLKKYNPRTTFDSLQAGEIIKFPIVVFRKTD